MRRHLSILVPIVVLLLSGCGAATHRGTAHVWELEEIQLQAAREYANPYTDVLAWVDLEGPDFSKRVYGFWDGGRTWRVRFVATAPGEWSWRSGSNQEGDNGLNGATGRADGQ